MPAKLTYEAGIVTDNLYNPSHCLCGVDTSVLVYYSTKCCVKANEPRKQLMLLASSSFNPS